MKSPEVVVILHDCSGYVRPSAFPYEIYDYFSTYTKNYISILMGVILNEILISQSVQNSTLNESGTLIYTWYSPTDRDENRECA